MPRRSKPPKHGQADIVVQKLSTGEIVRPKYYEDDFTGKLMPMPEYYGPFKPPRDAYAEHLVELEQQRMNKQKLLDVVKIIPGHGYHLNKPPELKLTHNQLKTDSGLVITIGSPKPWRRM